MAPRSTSTQLNQEGAEEMGVQEILTALEQRVYIATPAARGRRNDELRRERRAGASVAALAREYGISERHVRRIITGGLK